MRRILLSAVIGAGAFCAQNVQAGVVTDTLQCLIDNHGTVQVGDKLFSDFGYTRTGDMPDASQVNVLKQIDLDGNNNATAWGIRFQGAFQDLAGGGASDALITYTVTVLDPNMAISDAHIAGNPDVTGNGHMVVTETFLPDNANAKIKIYDIHPGPFQLADWTSFLPNTYKTIHVQKDILADAGNFQEIPRFVSDTQIPTGSVVTMSFVDQTFSQVPEPATLALLGLAGPALLLRRRKA